MYRQPVLDHKRLLTNIALKRPFAGVHHLHMLIALSAMAEFHIALGACVRFVTRMLAHMIREFETCNECFVTMIAGVRFLLGMPMLHVLQSIVFVGKTFVAFATLERSL